MRKDVLQAPDSIFLMPPDFSEQSLRAPRQPAWRVMLRKISKSKLALPGAAIILVFVVMAAAAPLLTSHSPYEINLAGALLPPSWQHPFGTDELGRDVFARILYGGRLSILEGVFAVAIAMAIGVPLGLISGYIGGLADSAIMRCIDVLLAFPGVLLAIVFVSVLGPSLVNAMIAVGIYTMPIFARLARGTTLSVKENLYIEACRAVGMSHSRIVFRHILPNIASTLWTMAALRVALAILTASSLSFLGLGAQAPSPEWGAMLATGRGYMIIAPHVVIFPGAAIVLLVLGINLLQDGLRLALDPQSGDHS